jgi:two-component system response regulator ChvI
MPPNESGSLGPIRVFLVDDEDEYREAVSAELADLGFFIAGFSEGAALIKFIDDGNATDVIVLDWRLRESTGLEILSQLRRRGINLPVVFLTGVASAEHERAAFDNGAVDFVDKTRGVQILARRIQLIVDSKRALTASQLPVEDLACGDLVLRPKTSRAFWKGVDLALTVTEFNIVHRLATHAGEFLTYRLVYDCVHGSGFAAGCGEDGYRTNVRSSIKRIRGKFVAIDGDFDEIENFPAFGYRWRAATRSGD